MESKINVTGLFPVCIFSNFIERKFSTIEKKAINNAYIKSIKNDTNYISKEFNLLNSEPFKKINNFIVNNLKIYVKDILKPKHAIELLITESWLNFTKKGESHHIHSHHNSFISGVMYFDCIENDTIVFYKEEKDFFKIETSEWNLFNSLSWNFPVQKGQLVLFPSNLKHSVNVNNQDKTRISLSFNTFPKGVVNNNTSIKLNLCN